MSGNKPIQQDADCWIPPFLSFLLSLVFWAAIISLIYSRKKEWKNNLLRWKLGIVFNSTHIWKNEQAADGGKANLS